MAQISILLVEDDPSLGAITATLLEAEHYRVVWAQGARAAVDELCRPNERHADVMLLDLDLCGERGETIVRQAEEEGCAIPPVVIVSGQPLGDCEATASDIGAFAIVHKPYQFATLLDVIARATLPRTSHH